MQATPSSEQIPVSISQLFSYPFRIFFLAMTVLTVAGIPLWVLEVTGVLHLPLAMPALFWHQHEMLFGFLTAAIAGFLLTAVCVWTQTERTHGFPLVLLFSVWLAGRLLLALGGSLPEWLVQGVNLAFLPLVMIDAGWRVWHARQKRQAMILVVLGLLWLMQVGFVTRLDMAFSHGALIMAMALISIIGGRITPAFTAGWLRQRGGNAEAVKMIPGLDMAALFSMILLMASLVTGWHTNAWSHAAGAGAVGCLILGVIARVSLGHTGRPLKLPKGMVLAFVAIQLAAVVRVLTAFSVIPWHPGIGTSTLLWILAYGLFLVRYAGILARPRADGREG